MKKVCLLIAAMSFVTVFAEDVSASDDMDGVAPSSSMYSTGGDRDGMYVGAVVGLGLPSALDDKKAKTVVSNTDSDDIESKVSLDNGAQYGLAFGIKMGCLRYEAEIGYSNFDVDKYTTNDSTAFRAAATVTATKDISDFSVTTYMVNAHYDIPVGDVVVPHIGVGIGGATVKLDANNATFNTTDGSTNSVTKFAYQAIVGVDMPFDSANVGIHYRYQGVGSHNYRLDTTATRFHRLSSSFSQGTVGLNFSYHL